MTTSPLRDPIRATATDLPAAVARVLDASIGEPAAGSPIAIEAAGMSFAAVSWGSGPPLLLLHGITASASTWWRVGPALAAAGWRVIAPDLPGHGHTDPPRPQPGRARFVETAVQVAAFARAAGLAPAEGSAPGLTVVGHSWGAMVAAHLPLAGLSPGRLVLYDPPVLPESIARARVETPDEPIDLPPDQILATIGRDNPGWPLEDRRAKAIGLIDCDRSFVVDILLSNGTWDAGLAAVSSAAAAGTSIVVVRADPAAGGTLPDAMAREMAHRLGVDRVLTIAGADHSSHRLHPEATMVALLRGLTVG